MAQAVTVKRPVTADDARAVELASVISSVPAARHTVAEDLRAARIPQAVLENVLLIVTELVSNAILHARPLQLADSREGILLRWTITNRHVLVDVTDGGGGDRPELRQTPSVEAEGRGLAIVNALARDWSVRVEDGQVTVQAAVGEWDGLAEE